MQVAETSSYFLISWKRGDFTGRTLEGKPNHRLFRWSRNWGSSGNLLSGCGRPAVPGEALSLLVHTHYQQGLSASLSAQLPSCTTRRTPSLLDPLTVPGARSLGCAPAPPSLLHRAARGAFEPLLNPAASPPRAQGPPSASSLSLRKGPSSSFPLVSYSPPLILVLQPNRLLVDSESCQTFSGAWRTTQAGALAGNGTGDPFVTGQDSTTELHQPGRRPFLSFLF